MKWKGCASGHGIIYSTSLTYAETVSIQVLNQALPKHKLEELLLTQK